MDWVTRDRLEAGKQAHTPAPVKQRKAQSLGLPDSEAKRLPAANGKRVLVTPSWQGSGRKASPCISYSVSDPTPRLFTPSREGRRAQTRQVRQAVAPEVVRAGLTNNIGQDYS